MAGFNKVITFTPPSYPPGYCWPLTPQAFVNGIEVWGGAWVFNSDVANSFYHTGSATPTGADATNYPWFRYGLGAGNEWQEGWYRWNTAFGVWTRPHPVAASSSVRMLWAGTENDLWAWDGGDGSDPSAVTPAGVTGAMWEVDRGTNSDPTIYEAKMLMTPGTLPSGTAVAIGDTGGTEEHTLTEDEMPSHVHTVSTESNVDINQTSNRTLAGTGGSAGEFGGTMNTGAVGGADPHNNMPPYRAIYLVKRTARTFYSV